MAKQIFDFRTQILIPGAWGERLNAIAEGRGQRLAELIREIIRGYLDDQDRLLAERDYVDQGGRLAAGRKGERA